MPLLMLIISKMEQIVQCAVIKCISHEHETPPYTASHILSKQWYHIAVRHPVEDHQSSTIRSSQIPNCWREKASAEEDLDVCYRILWLFYDD